MNILLGDLAKCAEFDIRSCKECQFSNGGQFFAAANGTVVHIYSTYTFDTLGALRGHSGKVKSLAWSSDDTRLVTCGLDGAVYEWNLKDLRRVSYLIYEYNAYYIGDVNLTLISVYSDRYQKTFKRLVCIPVQFLVKMAKQFMPQEQTRS
jgi:WD40 repeat protein